jgi:endonuclease YncB( thermonuclease family)
VSRLTLTLARALAVAFVATRQAAGPLVGVVSRVDSGAPESRRTCRRHGLASRCGQAAALALADHVERATVACVPQGTDRWGRMVAPCRLAGEDLGSWLVRQGWALAYRTYSRDRYVADEAAARRTRADLWAGAFAPPWQWRRDRNAALVTADAG